MSTTFLNVHNVYELAVDKIDGLVDSVTIASPII